MEVLEQALHERFFFRNPELQARNDFETGQYTFTSLT
jgi:hypothetical protein